MTVRSLLWVYLKLGTVPEMRMYVKVIEGSAPGVFPGAHSRSHGRV